MSNSVFTKNLRTTSQLPELSGQLATLKPAYFEVSYPINVTDSNSAYKYNSYKIGGSTLASILQQDIFTSLTENNAWTSAFNFTDIHNRMAALYGGSDQFPNADYRMRGEHYFYKAPEVAELITEFTYGSKDKLVNVNSLNAYSKDNSPLFVNKFMSYLTTQHNLENNTVVSSDQPPASDAEKHNVYIFQVVNYTSESWIAPQSGIFTCYGWLDEYSVATRADDNATRWVALEINMSKDSDTPAEWKILQLQPFISSAKCSYVGFTFPVKAGAELRIETGFKVGKNSRLYQGVQGSLTNHIANAFVGGIYSAGNSIFDSNTAGIPGNPFTSGTELSLSGISSNETYTLEDVKDKLNYVISEINSAAKVTNGTANKFTEAFNKVQKFDEVRTDIANNTTAIEKLAGLVASLSEQVNALKKSKTTNNN